MPRKKRETVRLTVDVSPDVYQKIGDIADRLHTSKGDVLRKGLAYMEVAVEAKEQGKKFGVAESDQILTTEIIGL